ncbi:MAG: hypothetical protein ACOCQR_00360 [bacterium]
MDFELKVTGKECGLFLSKYFNKPQYKENKGWKGNFNLQELSAHNFLRQASQYEVNTDVYCVITSFEDLQKFVSALKYNLNPKYNNSVLEIAQRYWRQWFPEESEHSFEDFMKREHNIGLSVKYEYSGRQGELIPIGWVSDG